MSGAPARPTAAARAACVVATSCPRCGAPLDFAEASNAVRCTHCASVLLVTGRRRTLSYAIAARLTPSEARAQAGFTQPAARAARLGTPRLLLVPYHRVTGEEVFWRRHAVRRELAEAAVDAVEDLGDRLARVLEGSGRARTTRWEIELAGRAIERNVLACDASGIASWSLGVRPTVLRLELFQRSTIEPHGAVVPPTRPGEATLASALASQGGDVLARDTLRTVLSVVYFPLWVVEARAARGVSLVVIDAVTGTVVARDADPSVLERLGDGSSVADRVLGFRPLCCPNCGWDLPVRPDDVVFHCTSCERSWELVGEDLEPIESVVPSAPAGAVRLPFWEVRAQAAVDGEPAAKLPERLFAPAFRWRVKKMLCVLGGRLARRAPEIAAGVEKSASLVGCSLDRRDATTLARLVAQHLVIEAAPARWARPGATAPRVEIVPGASRLVWLPFACDGYSLRDPLTGCSLPRRAVEDVLELDADAEA